MSLNLTALRKAIDALECSPAIAKNKKVDLSDDDLLARIRAGIAQNFRTAYEQCWKFTRRWIRENRGADEANYPRTRKELFRMASQNGLISDPLPWFEYGNARNLSFYTYDENGAEQVYQIAIKFVPDAKFLLKQAGKSINRLKCNWMCWTESVGAMVLLLV